MIGFSCSWKPFDVKNPKPYQPTNNLKVVKVTVSAHGAQGMRVLI